jgi:hypothetical protein
MLRAVGVDRSPGWRAPRRDRSAGAARPLRSRHTLQFPGSDGRGRKRRSEVLVSPVDPRWGSAAELTISDDENQRSPSCAPAGSVPARQRSRGARGAHTRFRRPHRQAPVGEISYRGTSVERFGHDVGQRIAVQIEPEHRVPIVGPDRKRSALRMGTPASDENVLKWRRGADVHPVDIVSGERVDMEGAVTMGREVKRLHLMLDEVRREGSPDLALGSMLRQGNRPLRGGNLGTASKYDPGCGPAFGKLMSLDDEFIEGPINIGAGRVDLGRPLPKHLIGAGQDAVGRRVELENAISPRTSFLVDEDQWTDVVIGRLYIEPAITFTSATPRSLR